MTRRWTHPSIPMYLKYEIYWSRNIMRLIIIAQECRVALRLWPPRKFINNLRSIHCQCNFNNGHWGPGITSAIWGIGEKTCFIPIVTTLNFFLDMMSIIGQSVKAGISSWIPRHCNVMNFVYVSLISLRCFTSFIKLQFCKCSARV